MKKLDLEKMNLFVSSTFFKDGTPLDQALEDCKKHGIFNIELGSNHSYSHLFDSVVSSFNFNYLVHNYFPIPQKSFVLNLASTDANILTRSIQHVYKAIDFCETSGALLYTFHPGFLTDPKGPNQTNQNYDFQWDDAVIRNGKEHKTAFHNMLLSIEKCVTYAAKKGVRVAIETEGSFTKQQHLLMQRPEEYEELLRYYGATDLGINLNIGHLLLAKNAFKFEVDLFMEIVENHIVAMELSHNNGRQDQHLPLLENGWYWPIILNPKYQKAFKILEFRETSISDVNKSLELFKTKHQTMYES